MALKPEMSILGGLATAGVVYATFQVTLPPVADVKTIEPQNRDIGSSERTATWLSAGLVSGLSLIARDPGIFIIGGLAVIALSYMYKHADQVTPLTGKTLGDLRLSVPGQVSDQPPAGDNVLYIDEVVG